MRTGFSVTFERYLPHDEGEEICEPDERGYVIQDVSLTDAIRQGLDFFRDNYAHCEPNCFPLRGVSWLTFDNWNDCTRDQIERGINESRSLHFPASLSDASRARVCRIFGIKS
jgi:hypothetical protein